MVNLILTFNSNEKLNISIDDFYIKNSETVITLCIKNKTNQDIELFSYRFPLYRKQKKYIQPIREDLPVVKKGNKETSGLETKLKHQVPKYLKAKEEIWVKLYYEDCSSYPEVYLYPRIIKGFSNEYFKISKTLYYGIDLITTSSQNMSKKYSMDDFKLIVEILISKGLYKELKNFIVLQRQKINRFFVVNFGCSFLKGNLDLFEDRLDPSAIEFIFQKRFFIDSEFIFKYGKTDRRIRETIKTNISEFEAQYRDNPEFLPKNFSELKSFMDEELIFFISKMWIEYKKRIASWAIPYFTQERFNELKKILFELDPSLLIALYNSKVSEESVNELIMEILMLPEESRGPSIEQVDNFLRNAKHRLFSENIENILISKNISDLESLDLVRSHLRKETYERLLKEITAKESI